MRPRQPGPGDPGSTSIADLCVQCRFLHRCVYGRSGRDAVRRCPGFLSAMAPAENGDNGLQPAGLCSTCRHLSSCRHDRSSTGVWHCEDYR